MKDKTKNILRGIAIILAIILGILLYPWIIEVKDGKEVCSNILGFKMSCDL